MAANSRASFSLTSRAVEFDRQMSCLQPTLKNGYIFVEKY
jgi:hypothetical protein